MCQNHGMRLQFLEGVVMGIKNMRNKLSGKLAISAMIMRPTWADPPGSIDSRGTG